MLAFAAIFLFRAPAYGAEIIEEKRVLILFPNQSDIPAYTMVEKGIKSRLDAVHEFHIEYFIEYMDWYRNPQQTYRQLLLDLYHSKFSKIKFDLVIAYSAPSLSWVIVQSGDLFSETPIVFSAILREQLKGMNLSPLTTGVLADIDYAGLLETAIRLHPQLRHVAVVNGNSVTDLLLEREFRIAFEPYAKRFDIIYLTRLPMRDIVEKVKNLPEHSVVLFYLLTLDGEGKSFVPREVASILSESANAPVYGCLDSYLGHGIVGGRLISMEMIGVKTGEMALRILRGEKPSDIPISGKGTIIDLFDWRQLKRFGIHEDQLPIGSEIRYRVPSIWEEHRGKIIGAMVLITFQACLIFGLFVNLRRRRIAEKSLVESEAHLNLAAESADAGMWSLEAGNRRVWATSKTRELFGLSKHITLHYEDFLKRVHPEDRERLNEVILKALQGEKEAIVEYRIKLDDGKLRWLSLHGRLQPAGQGQPLSLMGVTVDITDRKQGEELLMQKQQELSRLTGRIISAQEEELQRLSREIHDDLTQRLAALALDAALIEKQLNPSQSRSVEDLKGLRRNLSEVAEEVHDLSRRLHPSILDDLGLVQAVQSECAAFKSKTEIDLSITTESLPDSIPPKQALCLYRIIQESLQNIAKHSGAKAAFITLQGLSNGIRLLIGDKGVGFDPEEVRKKAGIGLSSMRERVQLLNGEMSFVSKPGQGTQIEVFIPTKGTP